MHTLGSSFTDRDQGWARGKLQSHRGECSNRARRRDTHTEDQCDQHSPAREAYLLTHQGGCGLGAEAWVSEVRSQGEDWGWLHEKSLKVASVAQIARRESGKRYGPA